MIKLSIFSAIIFISFSCKSKLKISVHQGQKTISTAETVSTAGTEAQVEKTSIDISKIGTEINGKSGELISNDTTPEIELTNVTEGSTIDIFTNSDCTDKIASQTVVTSSLVKIELPELTDGKYTFYFNVTTNTGLESGCSAEPVVYTVDTVKPLSISDITLITLL